MAKGFAIDNSMTDHGGIIRATQMSASQMGSLFLVAGDGHFCPKCKCWSKIIKSHDHIIFDGKAVAYVGDQLTCGAKILPKQDHVVGDSGSRSGVLDNLSNIVTKLKFDERIQLIDKDDDSILAFIPYYLKNSKTGIVVAKGTTDHNGYTERFFTEKAENIDIYIGEIE